MGVGHLSSDTELITDFHWMEEVYVSDILDSEWFSHGEPICGDPSSIKHLSHKIPPKNLIMNISLFNVHHQGIIDRSLLDNNVIFSFFSVSCAQENFVQEFTVLGGGRRSLIGFCDLFSSSLFVVLSIFSPFLSFGKLFWG